MPLARVTMNGAPWWVTLAVGALTAAAALGGTMIASWRQNRRAGREEWFRRVQWAQGLTTSKDDDATRAAGYRMLDKLSTSPLATTDDQELLLELTRSPDLTAAEIQAQDVDATAFVRDNQDDPDPQEGQ